MDEVNTSGPKRGCITLLSGPDNWPDNVYTLQMRLWLQEKSDGEITWPSERICNIAASLAETLPTDVLMLPDTDGGIVFELPHKNGGRYHIWDSGEIDRMDIRGGKVVHRERLIAR